MQRFIAVFLLHGCIGLVIGLTGCAIQRGEPPSQVIDKIHGGGTALAFSADETLLASARRGGRIYLHQLPPAKLLRSWGAHSGTSVNGLAFDGTSLLSAGYDARLIRWSLQGQVVQQISTPSPITHFVYDAQRKQLITGHKDGALRVWRGEDFSLLAEYHLFSDAVKRVAFEQNSGNLASSGADGRVFLIDANQPHELPQPPTTAAALIFAPDGQTLYGGGWFKVFRWDLAQSTLTLQGTPHHGLIKDLYWVADTAQLASISRHTDSSIYYLDPSTGAASRSFEKHALCGNAVLISPASRYLATTSDDASIKIWELRH